MELLHFISVFFMTGLIWLVQLVHYPLMVFVDPTQWPSFHKQHTYRITFIVGPVMVLQLLTSFWVNHFQWIYVGLSVSVFLCTFFISVPLHTKLENHYDRLVLERLVKTNWLRTLIWTGHSILIIFQKLRA